MTRSRRARVPVRTLPAKGEWHGMKDIEAQRDGKTKMKKEMVKNYGTRSKGRKTKWGYDGLDGWIEEEMRLVRPMQRQMHLFTRERLRLVDNCLKSIVVGRNGHNMHSLERSYKVRISVPASFNPYVTVLGRCNRVNHVIGQLRADTTPKATFPIPPRMVGTVLGHVGSRKSMIERKYGVTLVLSETQGFILTHSETRAVALKKMMQKLVGMRDAVTTKDVLAHVAQKAAPAAPPNVPPHPTEVTKIVLTPSPGFAGTFTPTSVTIRGPPGAKQHTHTISKPGSKDNTVTIAVPPLQTPLQVIVAMPPHTSRAPKQISTSFHTEDECVQTIVGSTAMTGCVYTCTVVLEPPSSV
eukprot:TRINITY_DN13620_c3_g1_i1.p1 TRINITY_DN13620_c3_g1~~TRINITY_DN13620_c3_g1_i1.p1  ORF type:complete len:354 (+),score=71.43 TRINITY_DN13620_c3_g1_i1:52-1113(+)